MATQPLICLVDLSAMILVIVFDGSAIVLSSVVTISSTSDSTSTSSPASTASRSIQPTAATGGSFFHPLATTSSYNSSVLSVFGKENPSSSCNIRVTAS